MGLYDRDYMKRRPDQEESSSDLPSGSRLESIFSGFLQRYPRLPRTIIIVLLALIIGGVLIAKWTGGRP